MTDTNQKQLGNTLWRIADQLRGAMDADDFREYMLSFFFLSYLSDNCETAAKKELGKDYPDVEGDALPVAPSFPRRAVGSPPLPRGAWRALSGQSFSGAQVLRRQRRVFSLDCPLV